MLSVFKEQPKVPFVKFRKPAYLLSLIVIGVGLTVFVARGKANFGVDFKGGTLIQLQFEKTIAIEGVRAALKEIGLASSTLQQLGQSNQDLLIKAELDSLDKITRHLKDKFTDNPFTVRRSEVVGPAVGAELRKDALIAFIIALVGMLVYIGWRFEFNFGVAAVIALFHDVFVCLGAAALTGREISLTVIAALLTIVGYSVNDTIVIFDRIREDLKLYRKMEFPELVNMSINQTLSRTVLTSLTVLAVVISLFLFGGEVINDFAFVMLVGLISGTYSTVFIAAPIVVEWHGK